MTDRLKTVYPLNFNTFCILVFHLHVLLGYCTTDIDEWSAVPDLFEHSQSNYADEGI